MAPLKAAYDAGVAEAFGDVAANRLKFRYGARGVWGKDLELALRDRFDIELLTLSCFQTDESRSFDAGYNSIIMSYIDSIHGVGLLDGVMAEVQSRRKEAYDAWVQATKNDASQSQRSPG